jgi:hypothetical protein
MYRQEKSHSYHIPILHEHFCFHGKNSGFFDSGQKHGGKHSFATLTPLTTPLSPLYPSSL